MSVLERSRFGSQPHLRTAVTWVIVGLACGHGTTSVGGCRGPFSVVDVRLFARTCHAWLGVGGAVWRSWRTFLGWVLGVRSGVGRSRWCRGVVAGCPR